MMQPLNTMRTFLGALLLSYYVLPFLGQDTGSFMLLLLIVLPAATFLAALHDGNRHGFRLQIPLLAGILFTPTVFLYYNSSAWVYIPAYSLMALAGSLLGRAMHNRRILRSTR